MVNLRKSNTKVDFQTKKHTRNAKNSQSREIQGEPREVRGVRSAVVGRPWGGEGKGLCETPPLGISNFCLITLRSHHRWCGGLKTLARDRRTLRRTAPRMGLPSASSEFMLDFWQSPPAFFKHIVTDFALDFRSILDRFSVVFCSFWVTFCVHKGSRQHSRRKREKKTLKCGTHFVDFTIFVDFGVPRGAPKSIKIVKMGCQK